MRQMMCNYLKEVYSCLHVQYVLVIACIIFLVISNQIGKSVSPFFWGLLLHF